MKGSTRFSAAWRAHGGARVDLGNDPPLSVNDKPDNTPIRRAVSLRWLTGTILTGFTSIFLMGGALLAAFDSNQLQAARPQSVERLTRSGAFESGIKGDRIRPEPAPQVASRQVLQVSTISRQGDHDIIKLRPFARITASLITDPGAAGDIPAFDPLKIFADNADEAAPAEQPVADQLYDAQVDGEVAVKVSPFPAGPVDDGAADLKTNEVEEMVRESAGSLAGGAVQLAALPYAQPDADPAAEAAGDPFSALGVSITPENVTYVTKNGGEHSDALQERIAAVEKDETLAALLERNECGEEDATDIVNALSELVDLSQLHVGQKVRIGLMPYDADGGTVRPVRVSIYDDGAHQATVARTDENTFVRADEPSPMDGALADAVPAEEAPAGAMPRLYEAIYATAREQQVPEPLIEQLIKIFSYEVDFQSRIGPGDSIEIFHSLPDPSAESTGEEGILFASITLGGVEKRYYRYVTSDDGVVDYYDADGRSAKKFLMRKPMTVGRYSSGFGYRRHPILGYKRLHPGVDWAAPRGTPIMAAGDGVVERAGPSNGYGNFILIKHTNGYETAYGHQSAFARGMAPGVHVRQGQIIGYVGSTGLSTGPHLHFEIRVNGTPVDPLRIRLPQGRVLTGDMLASFERERDRIDALLGDAPANGTRVASTAADSAD